ncbi:MAG: M50 family metallopeptidase [Clostridia bacterium]
METVVSILVSVVVLGILVFVHELGHYAVGRFFKFSIVEFSLGMGPKILKKEKNGILYSIRAFPIGGMCQFYGEDEGATTEKSFNSHNVWQRIAVIVAGPLMNILFAIILAIISLTAYGDVKAIALPHPIIAEAPEANGAAYKAGLIVKDEIIAINGAEITTSEELITAVRSVTGDSLTMTVVREGQTMDFTVNGIYDASLGYNRIGTSISDATTERISYSFFEACGQAFTYIGDVFSEMIKFFGMLFSGQVASGDVMGPVGTVSIIGQAVRLGFEVVLRIAILLSINLGIFNILPFPALDGGRLAFLLFEAVFKKRLPPEKEGLVHLIGLVILFGLIIFITFNDIMRIING